MRIPTLAKKCYGRQMEGQEGWLISESGQFSRMTEVTDERKMFFFFLENVFNQVIKVGPQVEVKSLKW